VPHITVAAAVIRRGKKYLLAQRPANGLLASLWEFPGGKQEAGETLPAALRREIQEELACQIEVAEEIGIYRHAYSHFKVTLYAFHCSISEGKPQAREAQALAWVNLDQLDDYPMGKLDRSIARTLQGASGQPALL
jgi:A/G-specific adenine glycosylase